MLFLNSWKSLIRRSISLLFCLCISLGLILTIALGNGDLALAESNIRAGQGESVSPDWYPDDSRSLDSMIDQAGVKPSGMNSSDVNDTASPIDRVKQGLKETAAAAKDKLKAAQPSPDDRASVEAVGDRAGERTEKAKNTFREATDRVVEGDSPVYAR